MVHAANLGDTSIFMVRDGEDVSLGLSELFANPEAVSHPDFNKPGTSLTLSFNCYLVRGPCGTTLIDCGIGNGKRRAYVGYDMRTTNFLGELAREGFHPDEVERVIFTHLHPDHVGWSTVRREGRWLPTFPNARYVMTRAEYGRLEKLSKFALNDGWLVEAFRDSLLPVLQEGQVELVSSNSDLGGGISLVSAPGHSCDHSLVRIECGSAAAVAVGDLVHHPSQLENPGLQTVYDEDPVLAERSRRVWLDALSQDGSLVLTAHFADRPWGRLSALGDGYLLGRWSGRDG